MVLKLTIQLYKSITIRQNIQSKLLDFLSLCSYMFIFFRTYLYIFKINNQFQIYMYARNFSTSKK